MFFHYGVLITAYFTSECGIGVASCIWSFFGGCVCARFQCVFCSTKLHKKL